MYVRIELKQLKSPFAFTFHVLVRVCVCLSLITHVMSKVTLLRDEQKSTGIDLTEGVNFKSQSLAKRKKG